ncbi:hypothetical protein HKBW3S42_02134, partial [Candidatus Hakubella thermalkaliphila]
MTDDGGRASAVNTGNRFDSRPG